MSRRIARIARRFLPEAALLALTLMAAVHLFSLGRWGTALAGLALGLAASAAGAFVALRSGELWMAWLCPRLDALALRPDSRDAPWEALCAADAALASLQSCGEYREFFPEARRHVVQSAFRAIAAHRLWRRTLEALREAPQGSARERLAAQEAAARAEIASLTAALQDLKARLVAATAPVLAPQAQAPLGEVGAQADLLAAAIDELERAPQAIPAFRR